MKHYHIIFTVRIFSETCRGPVARLLLRRPQSLQSGRVVVVAMTVLAEVVVVVLAEVVLLTEVVVVMAEGDGWCHGNNLTSGMLCYYAILC